MTDKNRRKRAAQREFGEKTNRKKPSATKRSKRVFYSVQSSDDRRRLASGGEPWPTGLQRSSIGKGLYCWASRRQAEKYLRMLKARGLADLQIVCFGIYWDDLKKLTTIDLTKFRSVPDFPGTVE